MPIKKAAIKALRQTRKNMIRNIAVKTAIKLLLKRSKRSLAEKKFDEAKELLRQTVKAIDKAVSSKILKQNTASRLKGALMRKFNAIKK